MPELPEVETVRLQLRQHIVGKTINSVEVFHKKTVSYNETIKNQLVGKTIAEIDRIGKLMVISLVNEQDLFLLVHLKMTGQLLYKVEGQLHGGGHTLSGADTLLPGKHTRCVFYFSDASVLYFNDMRLFGYTKLATASEVQIARQGFGPEPIDPNFDIEWFISTLLKKKTSVKAALLNQSFVSGLGNIYVDEVLWRVKVIPTKRADQVLQHTARALGKVAGDIMRESIAVGGTTFQNFVDTSGREGNFSDHLQVFGKQGMSCSRCGSIICKIRVAGRGTHFCPSCQV